MLPKIVPQTEKVKLPYSGETVRVRPFSVGTEKAMLVARETSPGKLAEFIGKLVEEHVDGLSEPIENYPAYEVDLMFAHIRILSVGDSVDLTVSCSSCGHKHDVTVRINPKVSEDPPETEDMVVSTVSGDVTLTFKPATYGSVIEVMGDAEDGNVDVPSLLWSMLVSVTDADGTTNKSSLDRQEFVNWAGDIPAQLVTDFIDRLQWKVDYDGINMQCEECGEAIRVRFGNVIDFFI